MAVLSAVMAIYLVVYLILIAYAIVSYIFSSLALMTMLKKVGHKAPALAWVPYASSYVYGELAEKYDDKKPKQNIKAPLLTFNILTSVATTMVFVLEIPLLFARRASDVAVIGVFLALIIIALIVFSIIYTVKFIFATWRILRIFAPSASIGLLMLCIFVSGAQPFVLFAIKNKEPQNLRIDESAFTPTMNQGYQYADPYANNNNYYYQPQNQNTYNNYYYPPNNGQNGQN